jgi:hypothetical protein
MTRLANPAIRMIRRRRRGVISALALAAMCVPATGATASTLPQDFKTDAASNAPAVSSDYSLPSDFRSDSASRSSAPADESTHYLPSNFRSDSASNAPNTPSAGHLPSNFRTDAADGHARQPAPAQVTVQAPESSGFDWGDAGIGAAALLGLLALGGGMTLLVLRQRGPKYAS